ncbi:zinc finger matrin-type protein 1 isoform X2 [Oryzias melastigma]|nr:zinc finger matrin-type protein 1 isoform X2 [Oryzias melastigma]
MQRDKNRFCELCNMVFSSDVVAKSHYEGKTHSKNLHKQTLHPPDKKTEELLSPNPADKVEQKAAADVHGDATATNSNLKDPDRYCSLCAASFNNPQMALQHYNGRRHQRNKARQELLKKLGDDVQQANSLMCQICGVPFDSVEMYQAHMQGNRHLTREKKISELFKSQPKVYNTFADELADYIQVQKARGINPKTSQVLAQDDAAKGDQEEVEPQEVSDDWESAETIPNFHPPHPSQPGPWHPVYPRPAWPLHEPEYNGPPPLLQCSDPPRFMLGPTESGQHRRHLSSSSCSTPSSSSSSSSCSSSTSDSDDGDDGRRRPTRKNGLMKRKTEGSDKEGRRLKRQRRGGERRKRRRKEQSAESEDEGRRQKQGTSSSKKHQKQENIDGDVTETEKDPHLQTKSSAGHDKQKLKHRKEKKKTKDKPDGRTEEEKLWDDSILGC